MSKTHQKVTGTAYQSRVMLSAPDLLTPMNGIISPSESESP